MRQSRVTVLAIVALLATGIAASTRAAGTSTPACTTGTTGTLVPILQDFSVNQGLESYTSTVGSFTGRLVRGKDTLVRPYLVLPSTCSGTIALSSATLNATIGGVAKTYSPVAGTGSGSVPASIASSSTVDPLFVVPAADLVPGDGSATFTATWSLSMTFTQNKSASLVTKAYSAAPIPNATTFEKKTNALRILVVPMGDASQTFSSQFPSQAQTDVQNGMSTLSRIYPVESGIGDLTSSSGGIRYTIDLAAMVDLKSISGAYDTNGRFCGSQTNFDAIKASLSQFLQTWNTQNLTATADRVVGAVYGGNNGVSTFGISDGGSFGCAEGMAGINSQVAWVRAIDDNSGARVPTYSWTGAVMGMEIAHTFGLVPPTRALISSAYHSPNIAADVVTPTGRAYNVTSRTYIANNHSVMRYNTSTSAFDNTDTLLEQQDYNDLLCLLTPGAATNPECAITGTTGTSTGVSAGSMLVGSGTTDGTAGNTNVVETYYSTGTQPLGQCAGSLLHVIQLSGATQVGDNAICLETLTSDHDLADGAADVNNTIGVFSFAVPSAGGDTVELKYNGDVIYQRTRQASPPSVTGVSATQDFGPLTFNAPTIPPTPDILILADTTGSMGPALQSIKDDLTQAGGIIPTILASRPNAAFGAANYRDVVCDAPTSYVLNQAITTTQAAVQTAVDNWEASGGCDFPEDQLNALYRIATEGSAVGWRAGSTRIVVWFGDANGHDPSNGHSLADVVTALTNAHIRVVAVPVGGTGALFPNRFEDPVNGVDQPQYIVDSTGGRLQPLTDAASVANAILAGLQNLPVTLGQSTSCDDSDHITLTLGTRTPAENPIASGAAVSYSDVVAHIAAGASPGDHTCTVSFTVNGNLDDALTQTFHVHVASASSSVTVTATSPTPDNLRVDVVYLCNGVQYPVAVGLTPVQVAGQEASFSTHFDATLACGDGGGQLVAYATDGVDRTASPPTTPEAGPPALKPPTAAIYPPFGGAYAPGSTVAYSGTGVSPQTGELHGGALQWTLDGTSVGAGNTGSFQLPSTPGTYTLTLTATDGVGSGTDAHVLTVVQPPSLTITHAPTGSSTTANPVAVTVSASDNPSGLASVVCSIDGAPVSIPAPPAAPGASYTAPLSVSGYGLHTVQCVATANDGLTVSGDDQVRIVYVFNGFLPPVNNGVTNTGKAGRTYPVKWQLKDAAGNFFSSLAIITSIQMRTLNCSTLSPTADPLETTATGGTVLRYDSGANQYIYNWQTPSTAGCYELDVSTDDGTVHTANFKLS